MRVDMHGGMHTAPPSTPDFCGSNCTMRSCLPDLAIYRMQLALHLQPWNWYLAMAESLVYTQVLTLWPVWRLS